MDKDGMQMKEQVEQDYGFALFTLLWATYLEKNYLVFGSLDFFPKEFDECSQIDKNSMSLQETDGCIDIQLNFCRIRLSCADALEIYESCRLAGKFVLPHESVEILMQEDDKGIPIELSRWPNLTVDKRNNESLCPFLAESWGCCRMHHLLANTISSQILMVAEYEKPIAWMKGRLLWDISMYPELLGSMHLVLPNPLIRCMTERLVPDSPNRVAVCFELREGKEISDLKGIKFLAMERGIFGIRSVKEQQLSELENCSFYVTLSGDNTEEFATAIYDDARGLLEWSAFGNFIMGFDIDVRVANARRKIIMPDSKSSYEVTSYESTGKIKSYEKEDDWGNRLHFQQIKRTQGKYAKKFGQHLFKDGTQKEAEIFIRELMQHARERIIIIDPFFATLELLKYVLAIPSLVSITIITGEKRMEDESEYSRREEAIVTVGQEILHQIHDIEKKIEGFKIQVKVMTGSNMIHDRFLIIDDQVWLSGNSLNKIGARASMLIRLPNPRELLDYLDELETDTSERRKHIKPLEEWIENKVRLKNENEEKA